MLTTILVFYTQIALLPKIIYTPHEMRNLHHRKELEEEWFDMVRKRLLEDEEDPDDVHVCGMTEDERQGNDNMIYMSVLGIIESSYHTPTERPRVQGIIKTIDSAATHENYDTYGFGF